VSPAARCPGTTSWRQIHEEEVMKKAAVVMLALMALLVIAPAAFAQAAPEAAKPAINTTTIVIAIGFGVAVAAFGGGLGQGRIAAAACEGIARNPGAAGGVRAAMILGLVFVETLTLFTFALGFLLYLKL
jgi:F-type H+-transporting ATPase subunit c